MESKIGLVIQFTGIFLITILLLFLRRSLKTVASTYWAIAWGALSLALFCLSFAFNFKGVSDLLSSLYFFCEYVFGLMLIFGCLSLSGKFKLKFRTKLLFVPFALIALYLGFSRQNFNLIFNIHALLLTAFLGIAFFSLNQSANRGFGWRVMRVALGLLTLDFFHYFVVFSGLNFKFIQTFFHSYLAFNPIIDLVLEILLGFGMVIFSLEQVLEEFKEVHQELRKAHEKLETIAHIDPLTSAFNRHAFYGFLKRREMDGPAVSGCVGFFDIDDLKPINDCFGHAVGDAVIRAVAGAIRDLIRAEDLIYRWGGDEFFVIMVGTNSDSAGARMENLERKLTKVSIKGADQPLDIRVSFGFTDFAGKSDLEGAVKSADQEMYRRKQEKKRSLPHIPPTNTAPEINRQAAN
ncbi:MAG: GGDEF domain-containing protein [Pyrinomonadaceae bacterium]